MDVSVLIPKMIVFVVLMVIGYLCAKTNFAGREFTKDASKMVINVFMTATIINSVLVSDACLSGGELLQVMLVLCMCVGVCWVLAAISCRLVGLGDKAPLFELLIAVMNNMFIALPVVETLLAARRCFTAPCPAYPLIFCSIPSGSTASRAERAKAAFGSGIFSAFRCWPPWRPWSSSCCSRRCLRC